MKIRIARNLGDYTMSMEGAKPDVVEDLAYMKQAMPDILDAFERVMEKWPLFSQVTLESVTDEELEFIRQAISEDGQGK